jgi:hypothetical protein
MDRWFAGATGSVNYSRQTSSPADGSTAYARVTWPGAGNNINDNYYMEDFDVNKLKGKTITISFLFRRSGALNDGFSVRVFKNATANTRLGGSWTQIGIKTFLDSEIPVTTDSSSDWQVGSLTVAVPDDGTANGLRVNLVNVINPDAASYIEISQMMVNIGETRQDQFTLYAEDVPNELAVLQRYYEKNRLIWYGDTGATNTYVGSASFATQKRATPTLTVTSINTSNFGTVESNAVSTSYVEIRATCTGTGTRRFFRAEFEADADF